ncbi:hypothetical protein K469DRAFT_693559 [Zopfia rhizophila CBS 207.26]|uniref:BRCT domain-containing protein n=1 Tax=Zopfia rhizophila CBS 207.26 TaxID=1314779 RepID=A0A6A6DPF6_9PEZI|nr:hypothetical protein K469DRAFT_693559 [Zopfia rhizophila CBS 207.26]
MIAWVTLSTPLWMEIRGLSMNPRSMYRLNERNDDWVKVKPEYMSEFGESLDCVIVGAYFGSGHRGGSHSSFLCGLLVNKHAKEDDPDYQKCFSFFKVGGGLAKKTMQPFVAVRRESGKIGTKNGRLPSLSWAAMQRTGSTKDQINGSGLDTAEREHDERQKEFSIEQSRRKKARTEKKPLVIAGNETVNTPYAGPASQLFDGLIFFIMTDQIHPEKKSKAELEALVKANGGKIVQRDSSDKNLIIVADKRLVKVSALEKRDAFNIIKPMWLHDCIKQAEADGGAIPYMLSFKPNRHMFYLLDADQEDCEAHVDEHGDSYTRDVADLDELRTILATMPKKYEDGFQREAFVGQLEDHGESLATLKSYMFTNMKVPFGESDDVEWKLQAALAKNYVRFAGERWWLDRQELRIMLFPKGKVWCKMGMWMSLG